MKRTCLLPLAAIYGACIALLPVPKAHAQGFPPTPVIVSEVQLRPIVEEIELVGTAHPRRSSQVASETEGKVSARFKEPGQTLKRGEAILRLTNDQLQAQLVEAEADVRLYTFRRNHSRDLRASGTISEDEAIESHYEFDRARSALQDLKSRIKHLTIRSPFDGALVESLVEIGEWVDRGQEVAYAVSADTTRVYVNVPERYVDRLVPGDMTKVSFGGLGTEAIQAAIVAILPQGYEDSRTFPVIVEFINPDHRVRGGMSAIVRLTIAQPQQDLLVHKDAIVGDHVFIVRDDVAIIQQVTTGLAFQGDVAVYAEGLQAGDLAIVRGNERLRDGQAVRVLRKLQ